MEAGRVTRASKQGEKWVGLDMTVWRRGWQAGKRGKDGEDIGPNRTQKQWRVEASELIA